MKRSTVALIASLTIVLGSIFAVGFTAYNSYTNANSTQPVRGKATVIVNKIEKPNADELLAIVNAERAKVGVGPLTIDPAITATAQRKSDDMFNNDDMNHIDKNGVSGYKYMIQAGIQCKYYSENIAYNTSDLNTSADTIDNWFVSKPHKDAILDPKYDTTGFGIRGAYVTEHFCDK